MEVNQISQIADLVPHNTISFLASFEQHAHCHAMFGDKILHQAIFGPACSSSDHNKVSNGQIRWLLHSFGPILELSARDNCLIVEGAEVLESFICVVNDTFKGSFIILFTLKPRKHQICTSHHLCF